MAADSSIGLTLVFDSVTITNVMSVKLDGMEKDTFETKYLNGSTRWKGKVGAFIDAKTLTVGVSYDKTLFASLLGKLDDEAPATLTLTSPGGSTFVVDALLKSMAMDFPEDGGEITDDLVFELSEDPTFTATP